MCTMSASHLSTCDMAAYMVNCIYQMQTTLAVYEFTDKHIEMLAAQVIVLMYPGQLVATILGFHWNILQ